MNYNAEENLLGTLIYNENTTKEQIHLVFETIKDEMFTLGTHQHIYKSLKITYENNKELFGTKEFFRQLLQISKLENNSNKIDPITIIIELENYWNPSSTINIWIKQIIKTYFNLKYQKANSKKEFEKISKEEDEIYNKFDTNKETEINDLEEYEKRKKSAIKTPYKSINQYIGSLQGGDMIILAGSTGSGKTCFMLNLVVGFARQGKKVDVYSLEMPPYQLRQRLVCAEANVDYNKFRSFGLTDEDKRIYKDYLDKHFSNLPIRINKKQTITIDEIRNRTLKSDSDIVLIDYLGLISGDTNKSSYERYSNISRDLKLIAMESNKPIIALHQLNRDFQNRDDKKPKTSDLRDSGKIEQDADMIWFVYRPNMFDEKAPENRMIFILAKNRHGESNKEVNLLFNGAKQRINDIEGIKYGHY